MEDVHRRFLQVRVGDGSLLIKRSRSPSMSAFWISGVCYS